MMTTGTLTKMNALVYNCGGQLVKTYSEAQDFKAKTGIDYKAVYQPIYEKLNISDKQLQRRITI